MVAGGGIAAAATLLIGGVLGAWQSTEFLIVALLAAIVAAGAAWLHAMLAEMPAERSIPGPIAGVIAAGVLAVLAIGNLLEMLFDVEQIGDRSGILGAVATVVLAVAAAAVLVGAVRRAPDMTIALRSSDRPSRLAQVGIALFLVGWAINLASYWQILQATRSLAVVTLAALIILLVGRGLPALAAWVGIVLGAIGALVTLDHWNQLLRLGETRLTLGITDFVPILLVSVGVALVTVAGVLLVLAARTVAAPPAPEAGTAS
jgi:hypothetical protein